GIVGFASLLESEVAGAEQRESVDGIRGCATAMLSQVEDLLELARDEADAHGPGQLVMLPGLAGEALELLRARAEAKGLRLSLTIRDDAPVVLRGSRERILRVLRMLGDNAIKFTASGRIGLELTPGQLPEGTPAARFSVQDSGIGIPEEQQQQIFQPFSQTENGRNRRFGGLGIGLALSRKLARQMGGDVSCESNPAGGTVFHFTLPLGVTSGREGGPSRPESRELEEA